jgi:FixJ family two-component response regulator
MAYRNSINLTDAVHPFAVPIAKIAHYLSNKEKGVIKLIAESYQNNGNAQMLNISVRTVEKHRANISTVRLRIEQFQLVVSGSNFVSVGTLCERLIQGHFLKKSQTQNL